MYKYFTQVIIVLSLLVNINLYSIDKKVLEPDPKPGRYGKVLSDRVYIRFKAQAVPYLNLSGNLNKIANIDAVKLLNNNAVIKLTPLLKPENSITYNNMLLRATNFNAMQTSSRLMATEEPLLRTFKLQYDGRLTPERFCKLLLETEASIEIAEPCYINQTQALPNDTYLESQTHLKLIKAYDAWKNNMPGSEGAPSVIIAVSDNGIDQSHPDLTGSIARNTAEVPANGKDDDGNGYIDDYLGYNFNFESDGSYDNTYFGKSSHGMNCAGIIGATANNGMGIAGVGNKCKIFPIKAGNDDSDIEWGYESIVYAAVRGFKVINCSWGFQFKDFSQIEQSIIDFAVQKDLAVIVASGNKSKSQFERFYPTHYDGVMGVGEVNQNDEITSNNCWSGGIEIMAPGIGNYTTRNNQSYEFAGSGTSFAAPVVAGVVGIVRAKHPSLNALQAIEFTRQCVDDITGIQANQDWKDFLPGRVNFVKAVTLDPFSMPAVKPLNIKYLNNAGIELPRYFMNDTVTIDINAFNYLGAANNLEFRLSVIKDNLQAISLINDLINIPSVPKESAVKLNSFKFVIVNNTKSKVYFRVDITGENGYKDFFIFTYIPSDDVQTYENQKLKFSVCDRGTYGFSPEERGTRNGFGFIYKGYENQLFKGGIAATVNNERVVASVNPDNTSDFYVVKPFYSPDKFTGIISDELTKIVNLELTQKVQFDENGNTPCMRIEVTAKNIGTGDLMNPSIGYYLDWDIADVYESNKIRLFPEAVPAKYTNKAAAHLLQYPYKTDYPVFGVMAYTDEANCQPQAAGFISSSADPGSQMTWLNSGTSIQLGENKIDDIAEMIGMKFPGALKPGESKKFYLMICAEDNVSKLTDRMKNFSIDITETPNLISPQNGSNNQDVKTKFIWGKVNCDSYHLQLSTKNDFSGNLILDNDNLIDSLFVVPVDLQNSTKYFWRISAKKNGILSNWSEVWSFTVKAPEAPSKPELLSPLNNALNMETNPIFTWKQVPCDHFRIQISKNSDFISNDIIDIDNMKDTFYVSTTELQNSTKYYWRINANKNGIASQWSDIWSFTTKDIEAPSLKKPLNKAEYVEQKPLFVWRPIPCDSYHIQVSTNKEFTSDIIMELSNIKDTSFASIPNLDFSIKYYWRVRGIRNSIFGKWSETWEFSVIDADAPLTPELISPENNSENNDQKPVFIWKDSNVNSYNIQVSINDDFTERIIEKSVIDTNYICDTSLEYGEVFYWRIQAVKAGKFSGWTDSWTFRIKEVIPEAVPLVAPVNNSQDVELRPVFKFVPVKYAEKYLLLVSLNQDLSEPTIAKSISKIFGTDSIKIDSDLKDSTEYFWSIIASNGAGEGKPGETWKFTTKKIIVSVKDENIIGLLNISPNPANDKLIINLLGNDNLSSVSVYNLLGYKVSGHTDINVSGLYNVDISGLAPGFYYLRAVINGSPVTGSFIIAR